MMFLYFVILSQIFCAGNIDKYYNLPSYKGICSDKNIECSFNVSYNYPISPKIPTDIPSYAILNPYRYIYLEFIIPRTQSQKTFYLEAYDTSNQETIISNGDCYYIDTTANIDYEIRIYKTLKTDSYIRFGFLGISQNFAMTVRLRFLLSISLYFNDIALTYSNSLNKTNISSLAKYLGENNMKIKKKKKREKLAKETISKIMEKIFDTSVDLTLFEDPYFSSAIIPVSPIFLVTVSYTVGLDLTTENIFLPESHVLSETTVKNGIIDTHYDRLDFSLLTESGNGDVIKFVESYNKRIKDMALEFVQDIADHFTFIVSTNDDDSIVVFILRYYKNKKIYYEIQIKIQFNNFQIQEAAKQIAVPIKSFLKNIDKIFPLPQIFFEGAFAVLGVYNTLMSTNPAFSNAIQSLPLLDNNIVNSISISLPTILDNADEYATKHGIDTAQLAATFLDMRIDEYGVYHADFDCWQQKFGYNSFYDFIFNLATSMEANNEAMFTYNNQNYILWAWKGDYINLGAGAELGFYYGGSNRDTSHWLIDKSLAMPMTLTLTHIINGTIVDNWDNWGGEDAWWITAFNPKYKNLMAEDLTASYTVKFKNADMFNEFAKTPRKGWSYDRKNKIASLTF